ncbi:hypothetical protein Dimus_000416 [Dionaea muscipula]
MCLACYKCLPACLLVWVRRMQLVLFCPFDYTCSFTSFGFYLRLLLRSVRRHNSTHHNQTIDQAFCAYEDRTEEGELMMTTYSNGVVITCQFVSCMLRFVFLLPLAVNAWTLTSIELIDYSRFSLVAYTLDRVSKLSVI